jgi:SlyX protein
VNEKNDTRVQRLEEKIAYLERHVTEQDKAMLELAEELAGVRRDLKALRDRAAPGAGGDRGGADEERDERPPHY